MSEADTDVWYDREEAALNMMATQRLRYEATAKDTAMNCSLALFSHMDQAYVEAFDSLPPPWWFRS